MALIILPKERVVRELALFSCTTIDINNLVLQRLSSPGGNRQQYAWMNPNELLGAENDCVVYDPYSMLGDSNYTLTIPRTGNYQMHVQLKSRISAILQEVMVSINADPSIAGSVEPAETFRVMYTNQTVNPGTIRPMPCAMTCIRHFDEGDVLRLLEGGVSSNLLTDIKTTLRQIDDAAS